MFAISQALALPSGRSAPRKLGPVQTRPPAYKIDGSKNWNPLSPQIGTRFCHRPICRRDPLCCAYLGWLSHSLAVAARCDAQAGRGAGTLRPLLRVNPYATSLAPALHSPARALT